MLPILVAISTAVAVFGVGGAILLMRSGRRAILSQRIVAGDGAGASAQQLTSLPQPGEKFLSALDRIGTAVSSGKSSSGLKQDLRNAGFHGEAASAVFFGAKVLLLIAGLGAGIAGATAMGLALRAGLFVTLMCGGLLFFIPNVVVDVRRSKRRQGIRHHLPDAIDLLEISVSAGMGLDTAWNAVGEQLRGVSDDLADEMALTNLEIHLSTPRAVAMRHMAERTKAEELSSLVAVMVQSERFGTSMTDALRTFAQSMRQTRSQRAEEAAEKMALKLIFPMIVFLFPAVVMVSAGPAFMAL
jgi:tight adherence protein C